MSNHTPEDGLPQQPYGEAPPPPPPPPPYPGEGYPPSYPAGGYPPPGYEPPRLRRTRGLATAVTIFVGLDVAVMLLIALLSPVAANDMQQFSDGVTPTSLGAFWVYVGAGVLSSFALLVAGILTMVWTAQARANAEMLSPEVHHERKRVWAWLGWIVPVVSLWFPFQVVRDVRRAMDPRDDVRRGLPVAGLLLGWWWFSFVFTNLVSTFSSQLSGASTQATSVDVFSTRYLDPFLGLTTLAAGIMFILIVRSIEQNQAERAAQVLGG